MEFSNLEESTQAAQVAEPDSNAKSKAPAQQKVRRRNRMITSCLECRRRKLKCDKLHPCTNCNKFLRDCMFLAPALDSLSQQKLNEIKDKMGSLEKTLEDDVARRGRDKSNKRNASRKTSIDLPGEASSSDSEGPVPEDEKALEPTPLAVVDASYEDDANDDVLDLGIRIGKMRMTERLGGFYRPKMSEELGYTLQNVQNDRRTEEEKSIGMPQLLDDAHDFLEPGPTYIAPGSGFIFGDVGNRRNLIDFLPTKAVGDMLVGKYYENVHFVARAVHWPSFQMQYDNFWKFVLAGAEPPPSQQALVLSIMFSAVASMQEADLAALFGRSKHIVLGNFQKGTEVALSKAQFLRTTKMETMQALVVYLIPMCRDQMSRAHSVLVGTAIRLAECMGLHRDPADVYGLPPLECQVRRILWFQLCFLDFRTGEVQGPRPCIKREDYDTKFPLNIDDADLTSGKSEESTTRFTDMTLSRIRFECNEMHRIIWYDRLRLEKRKISITHVLGKIESFRKAMEAKYSPILDTSIPIHHYSQLAMKVLLLRLHVMVLHRYMNNASKKLPDRLRQIILTSGTGQIEAAYELETTSNLQKWRWYNGTHQQWHTAFLLLAEVYAHPNRREADRIWKVLDFVFEPDLSQSRTQKARTILNAARDRTAVYRDLRRMRTPISMRSADVRKIYTMGLAAPQFQPVPVRKSSESISLGESLTEGVYKPATAAPIPEKLTQAPAEADTSWSFDGPATFLFRQGQSGKSMSELPGIGQKQRTFYDTTPFQAQGTPQLDFSSPSESSTAQEAWPPFISTNQLQWRPAQQPSCSPPTQPPPTQALNASMNETAFSNMRTSNLQSQGLTPPNMPFVSATKPQDDSVMLDIDWNEWDKLFPPDQNTGKLDISPPTHQNGLV